MEVEEDIILIAGPTASGKTGLAIEIAKHNNAVIINTDSMQVYRELRIITARPSGEEEAAAPHHLFGYRSGREAFSVAGWLEDVAPLLRQFHLENRKVIFVGGTGLYFNALTGGLSPMPDIRPEIRAKWRASVGLSPPQLHRQLSALDPVAARQLKTSDRQRILRALEVVESTGKSILHWQDEQGVPLLDHTRRIRRLLKIPDRQLLHERINNRFELMVEEGGLEEVGNLLSLDLDPSLPILKAIGVPQLAAHLNGEISLEGAVEKAKAATRQYAKRQSTWFRNSLGDGWEVVE